MNAHCALALSLLLLAGQATAACVADSPVETARWIRARQEGFAVYQSPQDPATMQRFLSPRFLALLKTEWQCQVIEEGLCAVDADPWTNALEGGVQAPITFELGARSAARANVIVHFRSGWSDTDPRKTTAAQATLEMVRDTASGCWLLDDLVGSKGKSLAQQLHSYPNYP